MLIGVPMDDGRCWSGGGHYGSAEWTPHESQGGEPSIYRWKMISQKRLRYREKHNFDISLVLASYLWMWVFVIKKTFTSRDTLSDA